MLKLHPVSYRRRRRDLICTRKFLLGNTESELATVFFLDECSGMCVRWQTLRKLEYVDLPLVRSLSRRANAPKDSLQSV